MVGKTPTILRLGRYALASSIKDSASVSCTTFNILALIYKRLNHEDPTFCESDDKDSWLNWNQRILDWLLRKRSSIICLHVILLIYVLMFVFLFYGLFLLISSLNAGLM